MLLAKKTVVLSCLLIAVITPAAYANALHNPFIWDDEILIKNNVFIRSWSNLPSIFTQNLGAGSGGKYNYYRPLHMIANMVDYSFWKLDVRRVSCKQQGRQRSLDRIGGRRYNFSVVRKFRSQQVSEKGHNREVVKRHGPAAVPGDERRRKLSHYSFRMGRQ